MYGARFRPPIRYGQRITPRNLDWKLKWPFLISTIIAVVIIICSLVIFALEIASLARSTATFTLNGNIYGTTASTGAGIWCNVFILIAGILILMIDFLRNTRLWATIAFLATIIAAGFSLIIIGLDAKAVQDGRNVSNLLLIGLSDVDPKFSILVAQLAFACLVFLLCITFIILYIIVRLISTKVRHPQQRNVRPPLRY